MNISDLKSRIASKIHGANINKVNDFAGLVYEAAGNVLSRIDPMETKRIIPLSNGLYDQVYSYAAPTDLKKDRIIDIRPVTGRSNSDNMNQTYGEEFGLNKTNNSFEVQYNSLVKTINIAKQATNGITINELNGTTDNGTWSAGGNAINLVADTINKVSGSASLKFDISAAGTTAYLENSTMTAVNLSTYKNVGSIFTYVYIPSITIITSVNIRFGTTSANYYHATATTTHDNTAFVVGWNLVRIDWSGTAQVGTPTDTNIKYLRITYNYNGTATTGCRVDNVVARIPTPYEVVYYSNYIFRDTAGTWIERPTAIDDSDLINLEVDGLGLLTAEISYLIAQEIQGEDATFDATFWKSKRDEVWETYMRANKSEAQKRRTSYYRIKHG
jgi:hypothetical protein